MIKYNLYSSILDAFQGYVRSSEIWNEYWGFSDDPKKTEEQFEQEQFQAVIDRINRVPFDSEAADKGSAFNEVVDCLIAGCKSEKMHIESEKDLGIIAATYNNRVFTFPIPICREFANYFKGASSQVFTEATLPTKYGDVLLYGYIDELMPTSVHDIKTTTKYSAGKFKHNWQHVVYPYCLNQNGNSVTDFEYNVAVFPNETYTEHYNFIPERDIPRLTEFVERFIEFVEGNKHLITDLKIFNKHENQ